MLPHLPRAFHSTLTLKISTPRYDTRFGERSFNLTVEHDSILPSPWLRDGFFPTRGGLEREREGTVIGLLNIQRKFLGQNDTSLQKPPEFSFTRKCWFRFIPSPPRIVSQYLSANEFFYPKLVFVDFVQQVFGHGCAIHAREDRGGAVKVWNANSSLAWFISRGTLTSLRPTEIPICLALCNSTLLASRCCVLSVFILSSLA